MSERPCCNSITKKGTQCTKTSEKNSIQCYQHNKTNEEPISTGVELELLDLKLIDKIKKIGVTTRREQCFKNLARPCKVLSVDIGSWIQLKQEIGSGFFGTTYLALLDNNEIVIKVLSVDDVNAFDFDKTAINYVEDIDREIKVHVLVNELREKMYTPNFVYMFDSFYCPYQDLQEGGNLNACKIDPAKEIKDLMGFLLLEKADSDLEMFIRESKTLQNLDNILLSIALQVLISFEIARAEFGMLHKDMKLDNILVKKTAVKHKFITYKITDMNGIRTYTVPYYGYLGLIADFGIVSVLNDDIRDRYFSIGANTPNSYIMSSLTNAIIGTNMTFVNMQQVENFVLSNIHKAVHDEKVYLFSYTNIVANLFSNETKSFKNVNESHLTQYKEDPYRSMLMEDHMVSYNEDPYKPLGG
jgi:serine/threonine protein kinase